jgi:hypothetical protein
MSAPMKSLNGEPCAGEPHTRVGGRDTFSTPIELFGESTSSGYCGATDACQVVAVSSSGCMSSGGQVDTNTLSLLEDTNSL